MAPATSRDEGLVQLIKMTSAMIKRDIEIIRFVIPDILGHWPSAGAFVDKFTIYRMFVLLLRVSTCSQC